MQQTAACFISTGTVADFLAGSRCCMLFVVYICPCLSLATQSLQCLWLQTTHCRQSEPKACHMCRSMPDTWCTFVSCSEVCRLQRRSRGLTRQRRQPLAAWPCSPPTWHQSPTTLLQVCHAAHPSCFTARASGIPLFAVCLWIGSLFHTASCTRKL